MLKTLKEFDNEPFVLIPKPKDNTKTDKKEPIPNEVQKLLQKYKDIIASDLPTSLPPIRDISHQIDLILGSSLPNKAP